MNLQKALLLFAFVVFTIAMLALVRWLLNQPSDFLLILAGVIVILYGQVAATTKAFTKNPFKK